MYIWKISELRNRLIDEGLNEGESFKYLMANTVLYSAAFVPFGQYNGLDVLSNVISLCVSVIGLYIAYKLNGGKEGRQIVDRYLSISWVVFVRFGVLVVLPAIVARLALQEFYCGGVPEETTLSDVVFVGVLEVVYFGWVAKDIYYVSQKRLSS